jgi:hypothetical protein
MDQDDRKYVAKVLNGAVYAMLDLLKEGRFAIENAALTELVGNFGKQLATAFEAERERELVDRWNNRVPDFRQSFFLASRRRYERAGGEGPIAIISERDIKTAEEMCPPPPDFPEYR